MPLLDHKTTKQHPRSPQGAYFSPNISWSSPSLGSVHVRDRGCMLVGVWRSSWMNSRCIHITAIFYPLSFSPTLLSTRTLPQHLNISGRLSFSAFFHVEWTERSENLGSFLKAFLSHIQQPHWFVPGYFCPCELGETVSQKLMKSPERSCSKLGYIHPDCLGHSPKWRREFTQHTRTTLRHKNSDVTFH